MIHLTASYMSVSYTHLDVYKRQILRKPYTKESLELEKRDSTNTFNVTKEYGRQDCSEWAHVRRDVENEINERMPDLQNSFTEQHQCRTSNVR